MNDQPTKTPQNITMRDIAEHFGVSVATVSRALSDNPRISKERRKEIQTYAQENNFFPNVIGEQLRHARVKSTKLIGVILPQLPHFYFSTILSGIEEEAYSRGYLVVVAQSNERFEREKKICEAFYKNKVCGVIVSQAKNTQQYDHFKKLMQNGIPLVFYDRICTGVEASRVVVDDYMGAFTAVQHLIETGCHNIMFYNSPVTMEISKNRFNGYHDALMKYGMEVHKENVRICDNHDDAEIITPAIMEMEPRPDAFFAANDDTAIGILQTVKRMGYRVPDDVSICGFTNGERAIACDPMLTTVEQRGRRVGEEAANILINKVEGLSPLDKVERRVVRTKLIIRGTTR